MKTEYNSRSMIPLQTEYQKEGFLLKHTRWARFNNDGDEILETMGFNCHERKMQRQVRIAHEEKYNHTVRFITYTLVNKCDEFSSRRTTIEQEDVDVDTIFGPLYLYTVFGIFRWEGPGITVDRTNDSRYDR